MRTAPRSVPERLISDDDRVMVVRDDQSGAHSSALRLTVTAPPSRAASKSIMAGMRANQVVP
jgi:hypothetical protein